MPAKERANLLALGAWSYAMFRGFERADALLDEAYKEEGHTQETLGHYTPSPWGTIDGIDLALARGMSSKFSAEGKTSFSRRRVMRDTWSMLLRSLRRASEGRRGRAF